ncbi:MAG: hypothetical protein IT546_04120 [Caulobacteraceae bacterium]|nr:hypothetical protein [Caulobacteraceae bacterium]
MSKPQTLDESETIGLVGDGDDEELLEAIERSFQVRFGEKTAGWFTVGDIYRDLLEQVPRSSAAGLCATSLAFYRVRAVLADMAVTRGRITPSTKLAGLTRSSPKRLYAKLSRELGVGKMPLTLSWRGGLGIVMALAGMVLSPVVQAIWPLLLLTPAGIVLTSCDVGAYYSMTVGDLARKVAVRNFAQFAAIGADSRPEALWRALRLVIAEETGFDPDRIDSNTRLF